MEKQSFNPHNEQYKKVEDLPENKQKDFVNTEDGFVTRHAAFTDGQYVDAENGEQMEHAKKEMEYSLKERKEQETLSRVEELIETLQKIQSQGLDVLSSYTPEQIRFAEETLQILLKAKGRSKIDDVTGQITNSRLSEVWETMKEFPRVKMLNEKETKRMVKDGTAGGVKVDFNILRKFEDNEQNRTWAKKLEAEERYVLAAEHYLGMNMLEKATEMIKLFEEKGDEDDNHFKATRIWEKLGEETKAIEMCKEALRIHNQRYYYYGYPILLCEELDSMLQKSKSEEIIEKLKEISK